MYSPSSRRLETFPSPCYDPLTPLNTYAVARLPSPSALSLLTSFACRFFLLSAPYSRPPRRSPFLPHNPLDRCITLSSGLPPSRARVDSRSIAFCDPYLPDVASSHVNNAPPYGTQGQYIHNIRPNSHRTSPRLASSSSNNAHALAIADDRDSIHRRDGIHSACECSGAALAHGSLSSAASKYNDVDLLLHPLFQKVFYVFCQQESTHELLEFWRDCANYRSGYNKAQLTMDEEAKILHRAYLVPTAKKYQRHLTQAVQDGVTAGVRAPDTITRFLFLDGERATEALLVAGSLKRFKSTPAFAKILPFVRLDPRMRKKNEEARKSLTGLGADKVAKALLGHAGGQPAAKDDAKTTPSPTAPVEASASVPPLAAGMITPPMQRAHSLPESVADPPVDVLAERTTPFIGDDSSTAPSPLPVRRCLPPGCSVELIEAPVATKLQDVTVAASGADLPLPTIMPSEHAMRTMHMASLGL